MKLASKIVLVFVLCLALIVAVFSYLLTQQAERFALDQHQKYAADLAAVLRKEIVAPGGLRDPAQRARFERALVEWSREIRHVEVRIIRHDSSATSELPGVPGIRYSATELRTYSYVPEDGERHFFTYVPMDDESEIDLEVAAPASFLQQRLAGTLRTTAFAFLTASIITAGVVLLTSRWLVGRPLERIVEHIDTIGKGDLSTPLEFKRNDELGDVARALNSMGHQLAEQREQVQNETERRVAAVEQLQHADRLQTVGRLSAGLAHEIGTPLNVISGRAELIASRSLPEETVIASAHTIKSQSDRIGQLVRQLLDFARPQQTDMENIDCVALAQRVLGLLEPMASKRNVILDAPTGGNQHGVRGDRVQLEQVVTNLVVNAIEACEDGGKVSVGVQLLATTQAGAVSGDTASGDFSSGEAICVCLEIADSGSGIPSDERQHIFEPFYTTKDVGEGTGLGLAIVFGIVKEHGGWIEVDSAVGKGSCFRVFLPSASNQDLRSVGMNDEGEKQ